jgi:hypothetical protein
MLLQTEWGDHLLWENPVRAEDLVAVVMVTVEMQRVVALVLLVIQVPYPIFSFVRKVNSVYVLTNYCKNFILWLDY